MAAGCEGVAGKGILHGLPGPVGTLPGFEPDLNQGHGIMETTRDTASVSAEPRVYLAGFDVFRADAAAHGKHLKALCRDRGMSGLYPLDGHVPGDLDPLSKAQWICRANLRLIREADVVMA